MLLFSFAVPVRQLPLCKQGGEGADQRARKSDEPEDAGHHLDGRGQQLLVDGKLERLEHFAVFHLWQRLVQVDCRLGLVVNEARADVLQYQENDETANQRAQDEQQNAQHPQARILGEPVVLDESASLEIVGYKWRAKQQDHEQEVQRQEPVGKDGCDRRARHVQAKGDAPLASLLIDALLGFRHNKRQNYAFSTTTGQV